MIIIMNLYKQYSYNPAFCAFRKIVAEAVNCYMESHQSWVDAVLCISQYLEISVKEKKELLNSKDFVESIGLEKLILVSNDGSYDIAFDNIEKLAVKFIIEPGNKAETKWDVLNDKMLQDYKNHLFPNDIFKPYFKWKNSEISYDEITIEQIVAMSEEANRLLDFYDEKYPKARQIHDTFIVDDPWQMTRGYGDDKYMVAYLEYISDQLSDLHLRNSL